MQQIYKPEPKAVIMEWWELECGDVGVKFISNKQMDILLEAEKRNIKLVKFDDFMINTAFIRGANKRSKGRTLRELETMPLSEQEKKFITSDQRSKLLSGGKK
jgi:hypothetical protein